MMRYFLDEKVLRKKNMFPPNPGFAHTQTTHPNNMIYYDILIIRG